MGKIAWRKDLREVLMAEKNKRKVNDMTFWGWVGEWIFKSRYGGIKEDGIFQRLLANAFVS